MKRRSETSQVIHFCFECCDERNLDNSKTESPKKNCRSERGNAADLTLERRVSALHSLNIELDTEYLQNDAVTNEASLR